MERLKSADVCKVLNGGIFSTIQDLGRKGYYAEGIPKSGAFDNVAFQLANRLVGNPVDAAGIEVAWGGLTLEFLQPARIAVTGGDLGAMLDSKPLPMWRQVDVEAGQRITFSGRKTGFRAYLSILGGFDVPLFLGSRSTYTALERGGLEGRKLRGGDVLKVFEVPPDFEAPSMRFVMMPLYNSQPWKVRIVYGLQFELFTDESIEKFRSSYWTVTHQMDRTGLRLEGPTLLFKDKSVTGQNGKIGGVAPSNIPTEGNPLGCIECPDGPVLIMLGPDGPCEGGYAKLGTVITADLYLFGQMMPGDQVIFQPVPLEEAYEALHLQNSMIMQG